MTTPICHRDYAHLNGQQVLTYEVWRLNGQLHRLDGPAEREWNVNNGQPLLFYEAWSVEGKLHRVDGPAMREWQLIRDAAGLIAVLTQEEWRLHGKRHRVNGPAYQQWMVVVPLGRLKIIPYREEWYHRGNRHRMDGPALRVWMNNREEWYVYKKRVEPHLLPGIASRLQRWYRRRRQMRWRLIERRLDQAGLIIWPGLMALIRRY